MTRILLIGRTGQTGGELERALAPLGQVTATGRAELDLASPDSIRAAIREMRPSIIVNAGGFTSPDDVELQPDLATRVNAVAPGVLADETRRLGGLLVHYSTAYVFDGASERPYVEDDVPRPINAYGKSKLAGEKAIGAAGCDHLILRTSWIYSLRGVNFLTTILKLAREKKELAVVDDQIGSPTWARAIAEATARMLVARQRAGSDAGIFHLTAAGHVSRYALTRKIIEYARESMPEQATWPEVRPIASSDYPLPAARPKYCVLSTGKIAHSYGIASARWEHQLRDCLKDSTTD